MQKSPRFEALFQFNLEIEMTFHKLKRQKAIQEEKIASSMVGGETA